MAVIQSYYGVRKDLGPDALTGWLGAFFDERARMNLSLMAQRMAEAAGGDDAKLLEMEAGLRRTAADLEKTGV